MAQEQFQRSLILELAYHDVGSKLSEITIFPHSSCSTIIYILQVGRAVRQAETASTQFSINYDEYKSKWFTKNRTCFTYFLIVVKTRLDGAEVFSMSEIYLPLQLEICYQCFRFFIIIISIGSAIFIHLFRNKCYEAYLRNIVREWITFGIKQLSNEISHRTRWVINLLFIVASKSHIPPDKEGNDSIRGKIVVFFLIGLILLTPYKIVMIY